jgi:thiamine transporter ThiT
MVYPASWNAATRIVTSLVILALLVVAICGGFTPVTAAMALVCLLAFLFAPRAYSIAPDRLLLHRLIGTKAIPLATIQGARRVERSEADTVINLFGNAGLFGIYGRFYSAQFGLHRWYASRNSDLVALKTGRGVVIISPDRADEFLTRLNNR